MVVPHQTPVPTSGLPSGGVEAILPVSLSEARRHLRLTPDNEGQSDESHPDDQLILACLMAACEHCEAFTGLIILRREYTLTLDKFPDLAKTPLDLGIYPVNQLISIEGRVDGVLTDLGLSNFELDTSVNPSCVRVDYGTEWPTIDDAPGSLRIRFVGGYADPAAPVSSTLDLPYTLRAAIMLTMAHLYENRAENVERAVTALPLGVEVLLRPHRIRLGMA